MSFPPLVRKARGKVKVKRLFGEVVFSKRFERLVKEIELKVFFF